MAIRQMKITTQITKRETQSLSKYFSEVNAIKLIPQEEEIKLAKLAAKGDQQAIDKLVKSNLRFVISVAKNYQGSGELLGELISAGNIGLIEAAKRFDESRGFKFISYAVWWIRQSIMQHLGDNQKTIRIPVNKINLISRIKSVQNKFEQTFERTPTVEEISVAIHEKYEVFILEKTIEEIIASNSHVSSLDAALTEDGESGTLNDILPGNGLDEINTNIKRGDLKIKINTAMQRLSVKEKSVITLYYGLNGEGEKSLTEIGESLSLTKERVRQIKEFAIRKMKYQNPRSKSILSLKEYL